MKEIDLAYAAGIIDGEGTVSLTRKRKKAKWRTPVVSFPNTSLALIKWFNDNFGGCIITKKTYLEWHSPSWEARLYDNSAIAFLKLVLPFLKHPEKIHRAKLLAECYHQVTPRNGKYSASASTIKEQFETNFFHPEPS